MAVFYDFTQEDIEALRAKISDLRKEEKVLASLYWLHTSRPRDSRALRENHVELVASENKLKEMAEQLYAYIDREKDDRLDEGRADLTKELLVWCVTSC